MAKLNLTAAQRQRYSDERLSLQELKSPQPGSWWQVVCNVRQEHAGPGGPFGLTPPPSPSPPRRIIDIQEDHGRDGGHVTSAPISCSTAEPRMGPLWPFLFRQSAG